MDTTSAQNTVLNDIAILENKLNKTNIPTELLEICKTDIERLKRTAMLGNFSMDYEKVDKYITFITSIPWGKVNKDNLDLANAKRIMDSSHYGMDNIKDIILDYLSVMALKGNNTGNGRAPVLLFIGLQGVGKTTIAKSIAQAMGRTFIRLPLGAIGSVQMLRGQSRVFPDAQAGQIVKSIIRSGTMNPVILLDEIDKIGNSSGLLNDVMAVLLEILDPEQNTRFIDQYVDYPIDLSQVFFICTANNLGGLSAALLDRMEVVRFTSYTDDEKIVIAKNYSLPKIIRDTGIGVDKIVIDDNVWQLLVRPVGFDAGLRQLERNIATMIRSAARMIVEGKPVPIHITSENLREFVLPDQGPLS